MGRRELRASVPTDQLPLDGLRVDALLSLPKSKQRERGECYQCSADGQPKPIRFVPRRLLRWPSKGVDGPACCNRLVIGSHTSDRQTAGDPATGARVHDIDEYFVDAWRQIGNPECDSSSVSPPLQPSHRLAGAGGTIVATDGR